MLGMGNQEIKAVWIIQEKQIKILDMYAGFT